MLLIGSQALAQTLPGEDRSGGAWDVWITPEESREYRLPLQRFVEDARGRPCASVQSGGREFRLRLIPEDDMRGQFIGANSQRPLLDNGEGWRIHVGSPATTALVRRAFLYEPAGWHRRIREYHALAARLDPASFTQAEWRAYDALRAQVLARLDAKSKADFNMRVKNEEFFNDFKYPWLRVHEHDDLHRATCYGDIPMYQMLKQDQSQAFVPRGGFEQLTHDERIRMVREECYALALERVLIPAQDLGVAWDENLAFQHALRRVCTNLARGWFRDFAIDHYPEVSRYDKPFLREYQQAVAQGRLRRKELPVSPQDRAAWLAHYLDNQAGKDRDAALTDATPA